MEDTETQTEVFTAAFGPEVPRIIVDLILWLYPEFLEAVRENLREVSLDNTLQIVSDTSIDYDQLKAFEIGQSDLEPGQIQAICRNL